MAAEQPDLPDSWRDEDTGSRRSGIWWLVGAVVIVAVAVAAFVVVQRVRRDADLEWPRAAGGRAPGLGEVNVAAPEVDVSAEPGVYAWNDFDGFHLWVINGDGVDGAQGTITSDDSFDGAKLATPGAGTASVEDKTLTFDLPGEPELVGVDYNPGFYSKKVTIEVRGPNGPIDADLVTLGRDAQVRDLPIVIEKVLPEDQAEP